MAKGRHHGPDQPRRRAQGGKARPDLLLTAVCRSARLHEAGACRRLDRRHQARLSGGGVAAHADEEGVHARRHAVRAQHALFRQPEELRDREGVRRLVRRQVQGLSRMGSRSRLFRDRILQAGGREGDEGQRRQLAVTGGRDPGDDRPRDREPWWQGNLAQGQDRRPDIRARLHDAQEQLRLCDARRTLRYDVFGRLAESLLVRISGSGSRLRSSRSSLPT